MATDKTLNLGGKLKPGPQPMDALKDLGNQRTPAGPLPSAIPDLGGILKPGSAQRVMPGELSRIITGHPGLRQSAPNFGGKLKPGRSDKFTFVPSAHRNGARGL